MKNYNKRLFQNTYIHTYIPEANERHWRSGWKEYSNGNRVMK